MFLAIANALALAAGHGVQFLHALLDGRVVFTQTAPPTAKARAQALIRSALVVFVKSVDDEERLHAASQRDQANVTTLAQHEIADLLQRRGERAGVAGPLRGQNVGGAFAAPADEQRQELGEHADEIENRQHHDEAGNAAIGREEPLLVLVDLVRQLVEQGRFTAGENAAEKSGESSRQDNRE